MLQEIITENIANTVNKIDEINDKVKALLDNADDIAENLPSDIIHSIIQKGGKVKIIHERYVAEKPLEPKTHRKILTLAKNAHTKREQKIAADALSALGINLERNSKSGEFHRHNVVYPFGGTTTIEFTFGDEKFTEIAVCAICDSFNRKTGISTCVDKLAKHFEDATKTKLGIE